MAIVDRGSFSEGNNILSDHPPGHSGSAAYVGRLAPAPTGALHLGNARTFVLAWLRARQAGGRLLLRLEDLDHPKVKSGAALEAYRDLAWLGIDWDAGPREAAAEIKNCPTEESAGNSPPAKAADPFVQSQNLGLYRSALECLHAKGLAYPCACSRKDMASALSAPHAGDLALETRYPGTCRGLFRGMDEARPAIPGREPGWRFTVDEEDATTFEDGFFGKQESRVAEWSGDFLIARGDQPGYQLAVVVDDANMGVTEVVRGADLLASTHRQLLLYRALGLTAPRFYHVPLVVGEDGRRLAKRHGDTRLSLLRGQGRGPESVLGWIAWSCGWSADYRRETTLEALTKRADFSLLPKAQVVVTAAIAKHLGFPV